MRTKRLKSVEYYVLHELRNELRLKIDKSKKMIKADNSIFETRKREQEQVKVMILQEVLEMIDDLEKEINEVIFNKGAKL